MTESTISQAHEVLTDLIHELAFSVEMIMASPVSFWRMLITASRLSCTKAKTLRGVWHHQQTAAA
jgi:hypothetical protein